MRIHEICNCNTVYIEKDASLIEVAKLMRQRHAGSIIVVDQQADSALIPVGIITDRDLVVEVLAEDVPADAVSLKDVMTTDPLVVHEQDELHQTIKLMCARGVRRAPVVDSRDSLVGVVSIDDILRALAGELNDIISLMEFEQFREKRTRSEL